MRLRTVLIGAGKVGAAFADDPIMAKHYAYATHAQVLATHPGIEWGAVVDRSEEVVHDVKRRWNVPLATTAVAECAVYAPELAVIATPPNGRNDIIAALPSLRIVLVEKPLGASDGDGGAFIRACDARGILVGVNLWRRADTCFQDLAATLRSRIGRPQAVFALYGNGLRNNGTHIIDFVRMLVGEVESVQAVPSSLREAGGPIAGDIHVSCSLFLRCGATAQLAAIDFAHYRENCIDVWGEHGRLAIMQEGLTIAVYPRVDNRAMSGMAEVASDRPTLLESTVGNAFYRMYDNVLAAAAGRDALWSPGQSALVSEHIVDAVVRSAHTGAILKIAA